MKVSLPAGKYIVAVSGGVDSVVLLDVLRDQPELELVVAHFNHGIRPAAADDERFVHQLVSQLNLPIAVGKAQLGAGASEDLARQARYAFLAEAKEDFEASAIITAHHQDDLIETVLINTLRGTGAKGLVALQSNLQVLRPLLAYKKADILKYAQAHNLSWREDETNSQTDYLRNYLRLKIVPAMSPTQRKKLLGTIADLQKNTKLKDQLVAKVSQIVKPADTIDRQKFSQLPVDVGSELVAVWLRENHYRDFNRSMVEKVNMLLRTAAPNTRHPINKQLWLELQRETARFAPAVR